MSLSCQIANGSKAKIKSQGDGGQPCVIEGQSRKGAEIMQLLFTAETGS